MNFVVAAACGALILACGPLSYELNPRGGYLVAVSAQVPIIPAIFIAASLEPRLRDKESNAARNLTIWRFSHVVLLTFFAALVAGLAATQLTPPAGVLLNSYTALGPVALVRNVLALTGAALICSTILGPSFGWILPLAWAVLPFLALPSLASDPTGLVTLVMQPDDQFIPFLASGIVWLFGAGLAGKGWNFGEWIARRS